eukprot:TRINITY_DN1558_c2_g1_i6.p1 TRINITY_DN1558_c2_g1~~TRINITY_DN1558_c2_g1_i6.p1  ORF type:complete len:479 (+),score=82.48 TRINITY_DN1558_c2_g1_i6:498-1934(+)
MCLCEVGVIDTRTNNSTGPAGSTPPSSYAPSGQDLEEAQRNQLNRRAHKAPRFPGLIDTFGISTETRTLCYLIKHGKLTAEEMLSLSARAVFLLNDIVSEDRQELWLLHTEMIVGLRLETLDRDQLDYDEKVTSLFMDGLLAQFPDKLASMIRAKRRAEEAVLALRGVAPAQDEPVAVMSSTPAGFPKMHDPLHSRRQKELTGSPLNVDEMAVGEAHLQEYKTEAFFTPRRNIEMTIIERMSARSQLAHHGPTHADIYRQRVHPGAISVDAPSALRGPTVLENWTEDGFAQEATALRAAMHRLQIRDDQLRFDAIATRPTLHLAGFHAELHASAQSRGREAWSPVLIVPAAAAALGWLQWVVLRRLIQLDGDDGRPLLLALVQALDWRNDDEKLDPAVGCPHVHLIFDRFAVIAVSEIVQEIFLWPDSKAPPTEEVYWVNWWVVSGELRYPEQHRWQTQRRLRWRADQYVARDEGLSE